MGQTTFIYGHARQALINVQSLSVPGSTGLGTFNVSQYSRLVGIFSGTGSLTLQWRMGVASGNFQVTSTTVMNSGPQIMDVINYGRFADFTVTAANSQVLTGYVLGEPIR